MVVNHAFEASNLSVDLKYQNFCGRPIVPSIPTMTSTRNNRLGFIAGVAGKEVDRP